MIFVVVLNIFYLDLLIQSEAFGHYCSVILRLTLPFDAPCVPKTKGLFPIFPKALFIFSPYGNKQ